MNNVAVASANNLVSQPTCKQGRGASRDLEDTVQTFIFFVGFEHFARILGCFRSEASDCRQCLRLISRSIEVPM